MTETDFLSAAYCVRTGKKELLVKWKDYPESESTWEPVAQIVNAAAAGRGAAAAADAVAEKAEAARERTAAEADALSARRQTWLAVNVSKASVCDIAAIQTASCSLRL